MRRPRIPQSRPPAQSQPPTGPQPQHPAATEPPAADDEVLAFRGRRAADQPEEPAHRERDDPAPDTETLSFPEPKALGARRRRRRGLWLFGAGLLALVILVVVLTVSPLLTIRSVEVRGNDLLSDERAAELLDPVVGRPLPQVGDAQVEQLLADEPVIDHLVVQGRLPDELLVEVVEHPPVAEVRHGEEIRFYNEDGEVIRTFDAEDPEQVAWAEEYATPLIGEEATWQDRAVFRAIVSVLGELPPAAREAMESASASSVDSVELELTDGRTVLWGSSERGAQKAAVLEAVLESGDPAFAEVETIDISTPEAPVTR